MNVIEKYKLIFKKERDGFPRADSQAMPDVGGALYDFRHSLPEIISNSIKYNEIVSHNPIEQNLRGMTTDEVHFKYWQQIYEIDTYSCDLYTMNLYGDKVELSMLGSTCCEIPIEDWIEILKEWQSFLKAKFQNKPF